MDQQVRDYVAAGMSPAEARRKASIDFGGLEQIKEDCRDQRPTLWLEQAAQDFRYAVRQLIKTPTFSLTTILTLALGIGATTAMFSVVNSVLFKPLPYPGSEFVVNLRETRLPRFPNFPIAPANYRDWVELTRDTFEMVYAQRGGVFNLTGSGDPAVVPANLVSHQFFVVLGAKPMLGRLFRPDDEKPGREKVVVLSHSLWLQQFGGNPEILGKDIQLNEQPFTVIGVTPPEFQKEFPRKIFLPLALTDKQWADRGAPMLGVHARLKPDVTVAQAQAKMSVIAAQLAQQYPDTNRDAGVAVVSLLDSRTAATRPLLLTLSGAVLLLLLIASTNVANLLMARGDARQREICVRVALGASRGRVMRQLLVESLLIAAGGALLGVIIARLGLTALVAYAPPALPRGNFEIVLDGRAILVTVGIGLVTGLLFGFFPALQSTRVDLTSAMKQRVASGAQSNFARHSLVVLEISLALMLLTGAVLLIRSFVQVARFDPGFNPQGVAIVSVNSSPRKYNTPEKQSALAEELVSRFGAMPEVAAAAVSQVLPISGSDFTVPILVEGRESASSEAPTVNHFAVTADYFRLMAIPLLRGRLFNGADHSRATPVAIISQAVADKLFPQMDPIGQRICIDRKSQIWREVVGIVGNVRPYAEENEARPQTYVPFAQMPFNAMNVVLRQTQGSLPAKRLSEEVYAADPNQPVSRVQTFDDLLMAAFARKQFALQLFSVFSAVALVLAVTGIYGVMAFTVSRRTTEFGVRIALGAQRGDILRMILLQAGRLAAIGVVLGVCGSLVAGKFLAALLYRTNTWDPFMVGCACVMMLSIALIASFVPAWRATKVDPLIALRTE